MEKRETDDVKCWKRRERERERERAQRSECRLKDWDSNCVGEMVYGLSFIYIKEVIKKKSTFETGLSMGQVGYIYLCYPFCTHVLKLGKTKTHFQT